MVMETLLLVICKKKLSQQNFEVKKQDSDILFFSLECLDGCHLYLCVLWNHRYLLGFLLLTLVFC